MTLEKVEIREVTKMTPKVSIEEGSVHPIQKRRPEENVATARRKKKVTKTKNVR